MAQKHLYTKLEEKILANEQIPENLKKVLLDCVLDMRSKKMNILVTGPTGAGKSSTINALFDTEVAKVGVGVTPETMDIEKYDLDNLVIWDTPGLGDGKEADSRHAKNIIDKLHEVDDNGNALIDLVLVILDGSTRDMGTSYDLINRVIIPSLGENQKDRILIAINQADMAMHGRNWDHVKHEPKPELIRFLDEKVASVKRRVKEATGVDVDPIYYSAGYKEDGEQQQPAWNLAKLLYYIVKAAPDEKRSICGDHVDFDNDMYARNEDNIQYIEETKKSLFENIMTTFKNTTTAAGWGATVGAIFGGPAGAVVGSIVGGAIGFVSSLFDW